MTGWHVTVRGATQAEIEERGLEQAVGEAAVVETDAIKVLAITNEYGTCVWAQDGVSTLLIEELVEAAMKVIS